MCTSSRAKHCSNIWLLWLNCLHSNVFCYCAACLYLFVYRVSCTFMFCSTCYAPGTRETRFPFFLCCTVFWMMTWMSLLSHMSSHGKMSPAMNLHNRSFINELEMGAGQSSQHLRQKSEKPSGINDSDTEYRITCLCDSDRQGRWAGCEKRCL